MSDSSSTEPTECSECNGLGTAHAAGCRQSSRELNQLSDAMLDACRRFILRPTPDHFRRWQQANATFVARHRTWWSVNSPDLDYDAVYGR